MAHLDYSGILSFIIVLSCCPVSSAEIVVKEGSSLQIKEGSTLIITCLTNTTADIEFLFNSSVIGSCFYTLGKCNTNNRFSFAANTGNPPYQYSLASKTAVNTSYCGTYYCRDVPDSFRDSINVTVTDDDNGTNTLVEEGKTISFTSSCIFDLTKGDMQVEWFIDDNITVTKLNLPLVADIVEPFTTETNCTSCGGSIAQSITIGLIFKRTQKTLANVYLVLQLSYPNFTTKERTEGTYRLKVSDVTGVPDQPKQILSMFQLVMIICAVIVCIASAILLFYCFTKGKITIFWGINKNSSCIACGKNLDRMCQTVEPFQNAWSERWNEITGNEWNSASISERKRKISIKNTTAEKIWQDENARSNALKCFFKFLTDEDKTELFTTILKSLKVETRTAYVVSNWPKLEAFQQNGFLPSLGQCTKLMSLLWLNLNWRLKLELFFHFWTSLNSDVQKTFCEMIFDSTIAIQELTGRIARVVKSTEIPFINTNNEKRQDKTIKTVEELQSVLSKCEPGQRLQIFKDLHKKINFKENNETFDNLFEKLPIDLKIQIMGATNQARPVFVTSEFWRKWSEYETDIPLKEVYCVCHFIASCTEYEYTIMCLENMDWKNIKNVFTPSEISNICMHIDWANIPKAIRQHLMDEQHDIDTILLNKNRHLFATSRPMESIEGSTKACEGQYNCRGVTRIQLYFDDNASSEKSSIAVTITTTTCMQICKIKDLNKVIADMFGEFELALYLRRIKGFKGSHDATKRAILKVLKNDAQVEFPCHNEGCDMIS